MSDLLWSLIQSAIMGAVLAVLVMNGIYFVAVLLCIGYVASVVTAHRER